MSLVNLCTVAAQVRVLLTDPSTAVPATGDGALDRALATLAAQCRAGLPLEASPLNYWSTPPAGIGVSSR